VVITVVLGCGGDETRGGGGLLGTDCGGGGGGGMSCTVDLDGGKRGGGVGGVSILPPALESCCTDCDWRRQFISFWR